MSSNNKTTKWYHPSRLIAWAAILLTTFGLSITAGYGAWENTKMWWFVLVIIGLELVAFVAIGRAVDAVTWPRRIGAFIIFGFCVNATIENAADGLVLGYERFFTASSDADDNVSAEELRQLAVLKTNEADQIQLSRPDAAALNQSREARLGRVIDEIAGLEADLELMTSQSEEGIRQAQTKLKALNLYRGRIDGLREELTEKAMEAYGEDISRRLTELRSQRSMLEGGTVTRDTSESDLRAEAIQLNAQAAQQEHRIGRIYQQLVSAELARSLGYWALLFSGMGTLTMTKFWVQEEETPDAPPPTNAGPTGPTSPPPSDAPTGSPTPEGAAETGAQEDPPAAAPGASAEADLDTGNAGDLGGTTNPDVTSQGGGGDVSTGEGAEAVTGIEAGNADPGMSQAALNGQLGGDTSSINKKVGKAKGLGIPGEVSDV